MGGLDAQAVEAQLTAAKSGMHGENIDG